MQRNVQHMQYIFLYAGRCKCPSGRGESSQWSSALSTLLSETSPCLPWCSSCIILWYSTAAGSQWMSGRTSAAGLSPDCAPWWLSGSVAAAEPSNSLHERYYLQKGSLGKTPLPGAPTKSVVSGRGDAFMICMNTWGVCMNLRCMDACRFVSYVQLHLQKSWDSVETINKYRKWWFENLIDQYSILNWW